MSEFHFTSTSRRSTRPGLSEADFAASEALYAERLDQLRRWHEDWRKQDELKLAVSQATIRASREAYAAVIPDFVDRSDRLAERTRADIATLREGVPSSVLSGHHTLPGPSMTDQSWLTPQLTYTELLEAWRLRDWVTSPGRSFGDPPFAGELWWGHTTSFSSHSNVILADGNAFPCRIWGHFGYGDDDLVAGSAGCSTFFS